MTSIEDIYSIFKKFPEISTDSRNIIKDSIFFALKGDNFNGNKFALDAIDKGAAYAIIDEEKYASENTLLVDNVLETLQKLAQLHRKKLGIPVLAITGTNGKTTTKELTAKVLAEKYNVSFTQGNLNNHIGVPLTLLKMNSKTNFGIVEMGANHPGEIRELCSIADPDFGIITNIGKAHLEGFGSFEGVKRTKAELYGYLKAKNGLVFINSENPILLELASQIINRVTYGKSDSDLNAELISSPPFVHVKANFKKGVLYLNTNLIGDYNFENILAAACIGNYFNVDPLKIQNALKTYHPNNNRSQLITKGEIHIIMDAYNANPTSMLASILSFETSISENKILILGDMLELGKYAEKEHKQIADMLATKSFKAIFLVGPVFKQIGKNYSFKTFENVDELCSYFEKHRIKNGNILIKGSRGIRLEKVLEYIN